jgi:hypothetical protein
MAVLLSGGLAYAQASANGADSSPAAPAVAVDRNEAIRLYLSTWQAAAEANGFDLESWRHDVEGSFATLSASRVNAAIQAKNYEAATRALGGGVSTNILGQDATDLVFVPLAPCRIIDTRIATGGYAGRLTAGVPKNFAHNQNLVAQGGNGAGCGVPTDPAAIAVTLVAVNPLGAGNIRAWRLLDPVPNASAINYGLPGQGLNVANTHILPTCQVCGNDFTVQADVSDVHLVADVVGYFWRPDPTCGAGQELHMGKCFETATRPAPAALGVFGASDTCKAAGGRLPDPLELRSLRGETAFTLADEYTDSIFSPDNINFYIMTIADDGNFTRTTTLTARPFRCVFDRHLPNTP